MAMISLWLFDWTAQPPYTRHNEIDPLDLRCDAQPAHNTRPQQSKSPSVVFVAGGSCDKMIGLVRCCGWLVMSVWLVSGHNHKTV